MKRGGRARETALVGFCFIFIAAALAGAVLEAQAQICTGPGTGAEPFSFLQSGFSQQLFATAPNLHTAVAFAPDGDLWWGQGPNLSFPLTPPLLGRVSLTSTTVIHGTTIHLQEPGSPFAANIGTGLTNGIDGNLYSNTVSGVVKLDPNTGAHLGGPFGPAGNGLGITPDPQTGNLVYVGANSRLFFVNPGLTTTGTFSVATVGRALDGIYFDPTGDFLFIALSLPQSGLGVVNRQGDIVQVIPNPGGVAGSFCVGTDGVAFHKAPDFVVSTDRNGTMTRYEFPNGDFTQPPAVSIFGSGGFRGDFTQVGPDSCLYVTQLGTRFSDMTVSLDRSVVRICPSFVPPPGVVSTPFVIGDANADVGDSVTFWGAQWATLNSLSGGAAPAAFKGFAEETSLTPPTCGGTWVTHPGNSSPPPATVPPFMAVIASSSITKSGPTISGDISRIVIVKTDPGYGPSPGHAGVGTVVAVLCSREQQLGTETPQQN